jgi:hypothetical protein
LRIFESSYRKKIIVIDNVFIAGESVMQNPLEIRLNRMIAFGADCEYAYKKVDIARNSACLSLDLFLFQRLDFVE